MLRLTCCYKVYNSKIYYDIMYDIIYDRLCRIKLSRVHLTSNQVYSQIIRRCAFRQSTTGDLYFFHISSNHPLPTDDLLIPSVGFCGIPPRCLYIVYFLVQDLCNIGARIEQAVLRKSSISRRFESHT